jgi:hypothetical protein
LHADLAGIFWELLSGFGEMDLIKLVAGKRVFTLVFGWRFGGHFG